MAHLEICKQLLSALRHVGLDRYPGNYIGDDVSAVIAVQVPP